MVPKISVIMPVYREEKTIQRTLSHLTSINNSEYIEIIVVDGQSGGNTLHAVSEPRIKKIIGPKGRGAQMNCGAMMATGNILLFLHADTLLPYNALEAICSAARKPHIAGGAFNLGIDGEKKRFRLIEATVRARTRLTRIPYGDQAIFIKKAVFHNLGGYPEIPIMEDVALMRRIKTQGMKITILPACVLTSARRWETEGIFYCTLRNWLLSALFSAGVSAARLAHLYP
ncbi:MAG: TIGR04283 family arsenosugar biosynthesis glycosyltransferase [Desulfobacterales bacterium]|jgi:rSAM/selenodomain-associated transferase 2|nr:TIGR04283 family arsenosugar biosynthesis glycosyltransferase [Desulfobacterales bacterium]